MAEAFLRKMAATFSDDPPPRAKRQAPPSPDHSRSAGRPSRPPPSPQPHSAGFSSPPPPAAAAAAGARSPGPRGQTNQSAAASSSSFSYDHLSLDALRASLARQEHTLSVCEMRLKHCLDSEDGDSSSVAAAAVAQEKRVFREMSAQLAAREKREGAEQRVRDAIGARFDSERAAISEQRRQVDALKQRLRAAFAAPLSDGPASPSPSPSPARSPSHSPDASLRDLLPRIHFDARRSALVLEHQNLRIDSTELSVCIEDAQRDLRRAHAAGAGAGAGAPGGPSGSADFDSPLPTSPSAWSREVKDYFRSSRKECVLTIQAALADIDVFNTHLKQAEAFLAFLHPPQPDQQQAHQGDVHMQS